MTDPSGILLVTGYPGAGKTHLARRLTELPGLSIIEADGLATTTDAIIRAEASGTKIDRVICVADAVNLAATLATSHSGAFARSQLVTADLLAITRGDVVDIAQAAEKIADITSATTIDARDLSQEMLARITPVARDSDVPPPHATEWSYAGPAKLRERDIDGILEGRPEGLYRLAGEIRTERGGLAVDIIGRARETRRIDDPGETSLRALSPGCTADRRSLDLWFMDAVASSTHLMGGFSYR